jgi:putative hydrolase of the HAD superfamily
VFRVALDALGVENPGAAVFVGDRPYDDVFGAKSAGLRAILRPNDLVPDHEVEPDGVIKTLPDLLHFVDAWS